MKAILKQDHELTIWGSTITLPRGTRLSLIKNASGTEGDLWAVSSTRLLQELTGNMHDPVYRYCFVPQELVSTDPILIRIHELRAEGRGMHEAKAIASREDRDRRIKSATTIEDLKVILLELNNA
jgi:hypothetical protein